MPDAPTTSPESPLSLRRLTTAFAAMLGRKGTSGARDADAVPREVPTNTRTITEALLFVGRADNQPLSADAIASTMRDVSAVDVESAVAELNDEYVATGSAIAIEESSAGYRMVLRQEFGRVRNRFFGKVQQATLSPAAMEVLAVIAYRQPVDLTTIDRMRGQKSQSTVSSLVRRGLVRLERPSDHPKQPHYVTTHRFLKLFQLASIDQLPQAQEFDAA